MTDIAHLRALLAKATLGEWEAYCPTCCPDMGGVVSGARKVCESTVGKFGHPMTIEDAELIAALRNAAPALLDELEHCRKLFDDAGNGEHNVLALVDHYQAELLKAEDELERLRRGGPR